MQITIYTTPSCPYCLLAKKYFASKKIKFEEIDVASDPKRAQEMIEISGQMGVPVILIKDKVISGFDQAELNELIK